MGLSKVNIIKQDGGLGRPLQSSDGISSMLFYTSGLNANVVTGNTKIFSTQDIESVLGITGDTVADGAVISYMVDEYFRQSESTLYVNIQNGPATDYAEVLDIKNFANGEVKQMGIFDDADYSTATITSLQAIADQAEDEYEPIQIVYSAPLVSGDTVEDLADGRSLESPRVSFTVGEDLSPDSEAARLRTSGATHVGDLGTVMGSISKAAVHENIGWVQKFPLSVGSEFLDPGFIDGTKVSAKSKSFLNTLADYKYLFLIKYVGSDNTYHTKAPTLAADTSDFNTIENNRTYDSAFRRIYIALLPATNSPLYVNDAGNLEAGTVAYFETLAGDALAAMENAREISGYSVDVDPDQNVLSTGKISVTCKLQPVGVAEVIEVSLGFALQV